MGHEKFVFALCSASDSSRSSLAMLFVQALQCVSGSIPAVLFVFCLCGVIRLRAVQFQVCNMEH